MGIQSLPSPLNRDRTLEYLLHHWATLQAIDVEKDLSVTSGGQCCTASFRNDLLLISDDVDRMFALRWHITCLRGGVYGSSKPVGFLHARGTGLIEEIQRITKSRDYPLGVVFEAYLTPPDGLKQYIHLCHSDWQQLYGDRADVEYHCAPLVIPDRFFTGTCSQAACQSALLLSLPFGGRPMGALDISRLAHDAGENNHGTVAIGPVGLNARQMWRVLNSPQSGVTAIYEAIPHETPNLAILRCLTSYVRSKFPVIIVVEASDWVDSVAQESWAYPHAMEAMRQAILHQQAQHHAIIIVGEENGRLYVNDSFFGVYLPVNADAVINAAKKAGEGTLNDHLRIIAVVPSEVNHTRGYSSITGTLTDSQAHAFTCKSLTDGIWPANAGLAHRNDLIQDCLALWGFSLDHRFRDDVKSVLERVAGDYFWWFTATGRNGRLSSVFLIDATKRDSYQFGQIFTNSLQLNDEHGGFDEWRLVPMQQ